MKSRLHLHLIGAHRAYCPASTNNILVEILLVLSGQALQEGYNNVSANRNVCEHLLALGGLVFGSGAFYFREFLNSRGYDLGVRYDRKLLLAFPTKTVDRSRLYHFEENVSENPSNFLVLTLSNLIPSKS
jgi:hypothetical protein